MPSIDQQIAEVFRKWGKETALEFKEEAEAALRKAGRKNPNTISLEFDETITTNGTDVTLEIRAKRLGKPAKYWRAIEEGRTPGKRQPPSNVFGKTWQDEQQIDPRVLLLKIQAKKKNGLSVPNRSFKKVKKGLNLESAYKSVAFMIARSIGRKGIKPKPFVGQVLNDGRIEDLRNLLTPLLGQRYKLIIKGLE